MCRVPDHWHGPAEITRPPACSPRMTVRPVEDRYRQTKSLCDRQGLSKQQAATERVRAGRSGAAPRGRTRRRGCSSRRASRRSGAGWSCSCAGVGLVAVILLRQACTVRGPWCRASARGRRQSTNEKSSSGISASRQVPLGSRVAEGSCHGFRQFADCLAIAQNHPFQDTGDASPPARACTGRMCHEWDTAQRSGKKGSAGPSFFNHRDEARCLAAGDPPEHEGARSTDTALGAVP